MEITIERGLFTGLYSYEIALLAMGVALFLVGIWALIRAIRKDGSLVQPLAIFPFVLVFAGYPSLQAVKFDEAALALNRAANTAADQPHSPSQKQAIDDSAAIVLARAPTLHAQVVAANAYRAIGEVDKAYALAEKVDAAKPPTDVAKALAPVFEAKLKQTVQSVPISTTPGSTVDPLQAAQIDKLVKQLDTPAANLSAQTRVTIARGYLALGNDARAATNIDKAQALQHDVKIDPSLLQRLSK
ncbi:MAG: hypothetical protein ABIO49_00480 [Dokdonella sp.]